MKLSPGRRDRAEFALVCTVIAVACAISAAMIVAAFYLLFSIAN